MVMTENKNSVNYITRERWQLWYSAITAALTKYGVLTANELYGIRSKVQWANYHVVIKYGVLTREELSGVGIKLINLFHQSERF